MRLSIIITNYKTPELLKLCLESVARSAQEVEHEIIVVDSEAQEETAEIIYETFSDQKISLISFKKNMGYAKLVNAGLTRASGDYVLILNADLILFENALSRMMDYLDTNQRTGMLGPQLLNFNGSVQDSCYRFYRLPTIFYRRTILGKTKIGRADLDNFLMKDYDRRSPREVDWLLGAALMVRRQALAQVGVMDERFFLYFEDVDWCRRFHEEGWGVVYFPEAKMHHYHGRGSKKSGGLSDVFFNKYVWIHIFSALKYFWKYKKRNSQFFKDSCIMIL